MKTYKLKPIVEGATEAPLLVAREPISLYGDVDPHSGLLYDGRKVTGKIIVLPSSRGSTVGAYILYALRRRNLHPLGVVACYPDPVLVAALVIADIPSAYGLPYNELSKLKDGQKAVLKVSKDHAQLIVYA